MFPSKSFSGLPISDLWMLRIRNPCNTTTNRGVAVIQQQQQQQPALGKMSNKQRSVTAVTARETFNQVNFHIKYLNNS